MKKLAIIAGLLLAICTSTFAQSGKNIYNKYSDSKGASAVYISPSMFKLIGKLPDIDVADGEVNLTPVVKSLEGMYLISIEDSKDCKNLKEDVETMVKAGKYELLMETKEDGETVRIHVINSGEYITSLVILTSERDETTFISFDGKIRQEDIEKLLAAAVKDTDKD
jgi:predicted  nucleic acid-binding Zn-ribbon protein